MIRFESIEPSGTTPITITLTYPKWEFRGPIRRTGGVRVHTSKVAGGTYTQILGANLNVHTISLRYVPVRNLQQVALDALEAGEFRHWHEDINDLVKLEGRKINYYWGGDEWIDEEEKEWIVEKIDVDYDEPKHRDKSLYFPVTNVTIRLIKDAPALLSPNLGGSS